MSDTAVANEEYRFTECDQCGGETPCPYEVCLPRPSDPSEMACVLVFCKPCVETGRVTISVTDPGPEGGMALWHDWQEWCSANGMTLG